MAEEAYAAYTQEYGYPPKEQNHLVKYAKKAGIKLTWREAKKFFKEKPKEIKTERIYNMSWLTEEERQKQNKRDVNMSWLTEEEKKQQKIETAKRYSSNRLAIDPNKLSPIPTGHGHGASSSSSWEQDNYKLAGINKRSSAARYGYLLNQLTAQGWDREAALNALKASNGNLHLAQEALMSGGTLQSGPKYGGGNGLKDRIKRFQPQQQGQHALDGGKWITKNRNSPNNSEPHALDGGKYIKKQRNKPRVSTSGEKIKQQIRKAYRDYEREKGKPPIDVQPFVNYCKNKKNVKKANWTYCKGVMEEMEQLQDINQGNDQGQGWQNEAGGVQSNNYGNNGFQGQSGGIQSNNWGNNGWQGQSGGVQSNNYGQPQSPGTPNAEDVNDAFEKLLGGHGSIKQRLKAMDTINANLNDLDISADNGKVLMGVYAEQIGHEDHIYNEYKVRIKAIEQMSDIFIHCLNKVHYQQIPDLIDESLPEILDALYAILDDPKASRFHDMSKQCIEKIIDAIIGKRHKLATINLCGILNEKINIDSITQVDPRFFTAQQIFDKIIFGGDAAIIHDQFKIDINKFNNKLPKWNNGVTIKNPADLPQDRLLLDLLIAESFHSNDDETFKDIIADCLGIMIMDPNEDINIVGSNIAVYLQQFNDNFKNSLEDDPKERFNKYYKPSPLKPTGISTEPAAQGNNGVRGKINKWNTNSSSSPHALDGGKYYKRNGGGKSPNNLTPQSAYSPYYGDGGTPYNGLLDFADGAHPGQIPKKRNSVRVERILDKVRKAYRDYEKEKSKPPTDPNDFMSYCKRKKIKNVKYSHCKDVIDEMQQQQQPQQPWQNQSGGVQHNNYGNNNNPQQGWQNQSGGVQNNNYGNNNNQWQNQSGGTQSNNYGNNNPWQSQSGGVQSNNNRQPFQNQSGGVQNNNYGNNNQWQNQSAGPQYNNYGNSGNNNNNQQQPQPPQQNDIMTVNEAIELLLGGQAAIPQKLRAMDTILPNLNEIDVKQDNGKVLLHIYADQVANDDYVFKEYKVRTKGLQQIADVFIHTLNKLPPKEVPTLIDESLPEILDVLYKIMDDNRARKFHSAAKLCASKIIDAVFAKKNKMATISLCGLLEEKINSENIIQAPPRFFTAQQLFKNLIFGGQSAVVNDLFNIDITSFSNNIEQWKDGVTINNQTDLPRDKTWLNLLTANKWNNNDDETFKDIIADCLSTLILDPNRDLGIIGKNLTVLLSQLNDNFKNHLETEAKHRFGRFYIVPSKKAQPNLPKPPQRQQNIPNKSYKAEPLRPYNMQPVPKSKPKEYQRGGINYYKINQETAVDVAAPTLPDI